MTEIISGFPGVGKSYMHKLGYSTSDSDSSVWAKDEKWPSNYIDHLEVLYLEGDLDFIFASTHKEVRQGLCERGLPFTLVYPDSSLKKEYLKRYKNRGSPEEFVSLMESNWHNFLWELSCQKGCKHLILESSETLKDVLVEGS